jgi:hypothetical protein
MASGGSSLGAANLNADSNLTRNTTTSVEAPSGARSKLPRRTAEQRAKAAVRMRLSRRRKQLRLRCYLVEIHDDEIGALIHQGYLQAERRADSGAVLSALYNFLDRTLV